jgi:hypothetical protein
MLSGRTALAAASRGAIESYAWIFHFGFLSTSQLRIGILFRMLGKFRQPFSVHELWGQSGRALPPSR